MKKVFRSKKLLDGAKKIVNGDSALQTEKCPSIGWKSQELEQVAPGNFDARRRMFYCRAHHKQKQIPSRNIKKTSTWSNF